MRMNIYLPDDLAAEVKAELGADTGTDGRHWPVSRGNISAICQAALRAELERVRAAGKLGEKEFERVEAFDAKEERTVAFKGKQVGSDPDRDMIVYLTPKGALAVVGEGKASYNDLLRVHGSYGDFAESDEYSYALVADVADTLGEQAPIEELDI